MIDKKFIGIALVVVLATGAGIWWFNRPEVNVLKNEDAAQKGKKDQVEQRVLTFTIDGRSSKGVKQWHLEGISAEIMGDDIYLNKLKATAYGDVTVNLTSNKGVYRKEKGIVELMGNVVVKGDDGTVLRTSSATWSQLTKEISTEDEVRIERQGMSARGKGASANSDERKAKLKKDVIVVMEPHTTVICDGPLMVSYDENKAIFYKNVEVVDKDGKMYADKLTVNFDPDTKKLAEVVAEGHVKVKRGKSYTLSEKAIYKDSTKSAQLLGRPQVIIDPVELDDLNKFHNDRTGSSAVGQGQ